MFGADIEVILETEEYILIRITGHAGDEHYSEVVQISKGEGG